MSDVVLNANMDGIRKTMVRILVKAEDLYQLVTQLEQDIVQLQVRADSLTKEESK